VWYTLLNVCVCCSRYCHVVCGLGTDFKTFVCGRRSGRNLWGADSVLVCLRLILTWRPWYPRLFLSAVHWTLCIACASDVNTYRAKNDAESNLVCCGRNSLMIVCMSWWTNCVVARVGNIVGLVRRSPFRLHHDALLHYHTWRSCVCYCTVLAVWLIHAHSGLGRWFLAEWRWYTSVYSLRPKFLFLANARGIRSWLNHSCVFCCCLKINYVDWIVN